MWQDIKNAPKYCQVGNRGRIIVGIDDSGHVAKTFYVPKHYKGDDVWLMPTGEGLVEWEPVKWCELP